MKDKSVFNISEHECSGCKMCADVCSKSAITFIDKSGFWYPSIDEDKCINCGLCRKKCPVLNGGHLTQEQPIACYGAYSKNSNIRNSSTSGGFFSELASYWIRQGGYCIAVLYDKELKVKHTCSNRLEDIERFRQSKYVQSDAAGVYKQAKYLLLRGEKVLFCGTPCQIEALKSYLGKEYDNLLTMDFVCLGICSPFAFRKYLDMLEAKFKSKVSRVWFKNKAFGWRGIGVRVDFENGKSYLEPGSNDLYMMAFVVDAINIRPNCQYCKFRKIPHCSDFTVADFWGIEKVNPLIDDNKGISAVFVNTIFGKSVLEPILNNLNYFETSVSDICKGNFSTFKPIPTHPQSSDFMCYLQIHSFDEAMGKYGSYKGTKKIKLLYSQYRRKLLKIRGKIWGKFR